MNRGCNRIARNDFTSGVVSVSNAFGYNARSELDAAVMGTNQFGYQYDAIGNRQADIANDLTTLYEANPLNQYASVLPSAGPPAYDADGNMISNGTFSYTWDAENRLAEVRSNGAAIVRNTYDFMGRRVRKTTATATNTFLYDGWLLVREQSASGGNLTTNSYLWGLDLSGSLQGAGGVGGLLCRIEGRDGSPSRPLFSFSDANGNVTGLVDTNGSIAAHYEYDPYGNLLAQSGDGAAANPFLFSSKYRDDESGLYYYGYRFYSPSLGRWLNRDPIEEEGGIGLYGYIWNSPVNLFDALGNEPEITVEGPTFMTDDEYDRFAEELENSDGLTKNFMKRAEYRWTPVPCKDKGGGEQLYPIGNSIGHFKIGVRKSRHCTDSDWSFC